MNAAFGLRVDFFALGIRRSSMQRTGESQEQNSGIYEGEWQRWKSKIDSVSESYRRRRSRDGPDSQRRAVCFWCSEGNCAKSNPVWMDSDRDFAGDNE
jgi:hypothetical protein